MSSGSTVEILAVVWSKVYSSYRTLHVKAFDRIWHEVHKPKSYEIPGRVFGLISSFLSNRWRRVVLDGSHYTVMTFLMMSYVTLLSLLIIVLSIQSVSRHLIFGNNKILPLNLNVTRHCRLNLFRLTSLIAVNLSYSGVINMKIDESVPEENVGLGLLHHLYY